MTVQSCDPLEARQWFKLREALNFAAVTVGFVVLDAVLWLIFGGFIAGTASIGVMFCVFFFWLHKRTIGIECSNCKKYIETDTPWICGVCGTHNLRTDDFPFVGRCESCRAKPKAYQCHHCSKLIFFTKDRQQINFARCVNISTPKTPAPVRKDEHLEKVVGLKKDIELTELSVKKAGLEVEWKKYKDALEPVKLKSKSEQLRSGVRSRSELEDEVRRLRAEADKEFANDPEGLKKRYLEIDDEARGLL